MPLSDPAPRTHLHTRAITLAGFEREDGLFDIEAELKDFRARESVIEERVVGPDTPLHHMRARLTITEDMEIVSAEAVTEAGPFSICGGGAETFGRLAGLVIRPGFLKAANERLGGVMGCTHLRELLQQMATVAFQTMFPVRARREAARDPSTPPRLLDTCHAYAADGPVIARDYPNFYTGPRSV